MSVSSAELGFVADQLTARLGWLNVTVHGHNSPLPWSCADVLNGQESGQDPTFGWRDALTRRTTRHYGQVTPPRVSAAFVLLWYLDLLAYPAAYAAALGPWVLDSSAPALRFDLADPELYPCDVSIAGGDVLTVADRAERESLAQQRYVEHAQRFATSYDAGVKMSSKQRLGAVRDTWAIASRRAAEACLSSAPQPRMRESCCFIFALPGALTCATCPRRAREFALLTSDQTWARQSP